MSKIREQLEESIGSRHIHKQEELASHVLLEKGGQAEYYIDLDKQDELVAIVRKARALHVPVFVLGGGSFVTIPEAGVPGLVIKNNCHHFDKMSLRGTMKGNELGVHEVMISAESGVILNQLVRFTIEEGLEGLEYQLGMPGTVGGAIATNAKYSSPTVSAKYVKDYLYSIRILDETGEIQTFTKDLPYFVPLEDEMLETKDIILSVVFRFMPGNKKWLWEHGKEAVEYRNRKVQETNNKYQ
jgi:UDP-N-acetylmuramate dehydrogenase